MDIGSLYLLAEESVLTVQEEATELLGLVGTPTGLVTGTLVVTAKTATAKTKANKRIRTSLLAVAASLAALAIAIVLVVLMWDVADRALGEPLDATLTIFWIALATAVGVVVYCGLFVLPPAGSELKAALRNLGDK